MLIAEKLIGEKKSFNVFTSTSNIIGSYQSDPKAYLSYIFSGIKKCHDFKNKNQAGITSLLK